MQSIEQRPALPSHSLVHSSICDYSREFRDILLLVAPHEFKGDDAGILRDEQVSGALMKIKDRLRDRQLICE